MRPSHAALGCALLTAFLALFVAGLAFSTNAATPSTAPSTFRAGAHDVDVSPTRFPVIVNAMFTERTATNVVDPLHAKALVLDDGTNRLAFCVVDSCMLPRELLDRAKALAAGPSGIPVERMLISSTHTHSAPSAMACLGSRVDPDYAASLPPKIAAAIVGATEHLAPARIGWKAIDDWDHTFNRRWIRRPDRRLKDPFGDETVRANMHPGYLSPDVVGPSGPVDPGLTVLAVSTPEGKPLAVLANYSQHYCGSPLVSSDYYGRFAQHLSKSLGADSGFVGILSQGTSGDLMWMDYGAPARELGYDAYAREVADRAADLCRHMEWHDHVPLRMAERLVEFRYRAPDARRLAWARALTNIVGARLPATQPEIYAWEAIHLHARQRTELKLQAVAVGDLGITAIPNEVFALTGLKLKTWSPFPVTMNLSLANGAEGYIPPPEQHKLGGYTTWPARTAGLEPQAEPRIVENLLGLLESLAGRSRRTAPAAHGPYPEAVLASRPFAYWPLDDLTIPTARDASAQGRSARYEEGVALYLPGVGSGTGASPQPALRPSPFQSEGINRAAHFAGGRLRAPAPPSGDFTVTFWVWNGLPHHARPVTGYLLSRGIDADPIARGDHLGIGGNLSSKLAGRLFVSNGRPSEPPLAGQTVLGLRTWHHVAFVRAGSRIRVHLDGRPEPDIQGLVTNTTPPAGTDLFLAERNDRQFGLEGRLDEVAVYDRALAPDEIAAQFHASAVIAATTTAAADATPPDTQSAPNSPQPASSPLSPAESLRRIHVRDGFRVELAAAEPLTVDPVAIDWDAAGRLWVVEMSDYPLGMDGHGKPGGRVRVLEDTDGDGRYDTSRIFAEGLNFPTGLLTWRDGVLVTAAPEILFLRDTNGDGRADTRDVLAAGLLEGNQQLRVNGLRWGLDNWVYCAAGGHHGNYGVGTRLRTRQGDVLVGSRDFRFRPDTGELEPQSGPSQFGRNRDDWGHWFGTQNIRPLWHYVLADPYLRRNPHVPAPDPTHLVVVPLSPKVWPASPQEKRYHSFDEAGHFTSACAGTIYRDNLLFGDQPYGQLHAFTCEPFHNVVQCNLVSDDGVSFSARRDAPDGVLDFFASEDRWCRPVMIRTGPDGALWVVDMYRYMIEHPDWLPAAGKAELLPHYRLGDDRGRIYRVLPQNQPGRPIPRLDQLDPAGWTAALESPNEWHRDKAHQLLVQRGDIAVAPRLAELARRSPHPLARVHALGVLDGLDRLDAATLEAALGDPHAGVRENALRLAEKRGSPAIVAAAVRLAADPSPKVRLQLAFTLGEWPDAEAARALGRLAVENASEPFLVAAVLSSALPHAPALAQAIVAAGDPAFSTFAAPLADVALSLHQRDTLALLIDRALPGAATSAESPAFDLVAHLLAALPRHDTTLPELARTDDRLGNTLRRLPALLDAARRVAADETNTVQRRSAAARLLSLHPDSRSEAIELLRSWLTPRQTIELQNAATALLTATGDDRVPELLLAAFDALSPATRVAALDVLLSRESWARALLERGGRTVAASLDASRRGRLTRHPSATVRDLASRLFEPVPQRAQVVEQFRPTLQLTGEPARGQTTFVRLCAPCHRLGNVGAEVGPDLAAVAAHPPEKLLANILDPSADIQPGYEAFQCELADGTELYGRITAETGNSLTFRLADGSVRVVLRRDVASLHGSRVSLMPDGLEAGLTHQDLADLIAYLRHPQPGPVPATRP